MIPYVNYHKHSYWSNIRIWDSAASLTNYTNRALELGHKLISTVEHGWQSRYIEGFELAQKHKLKWLFGAEVYWVKDRFYLDSTNAHMCILARTEEGRQQINEILGEANLTGFYYQPRVDLDLLYSLSPNDVWVTTACLAGLKYGVGTEEIFHALHRHFGKSFFLEVQNHHTPKQVQANLELVQMAKNAGIQLIAGADSHYIFPEDDEERSDFMRSRGIFHEDEQGWFLDYPDDQTFRQRFIDQKVLSERDIDEAITNTQVFLDVQIYENEIFDADLIKMITLYPELTQEERDAKLAKIVWDNWEDYQETVPDSRHQKYVDAISHELDIVTKTKQADYFLFDYEMVRRGKEKGGVLTKSGRGSGSSFVINHSLGFTEIDRIKSPIHLYPERFMSETRILVAKSLPDLDLNTANPEPFIQAQTELIGDRHSFPMVAYEYMAAKSAWKMFSRSQDVNAEISNAVSQQLDKYANAKRHAIENGTDPDDIDEEVSVYDFVDPQFHGFLDQSANYRGVAASAKPHPCGHLLYQKDIIRNIGIFRIKSQTSKKDAIVTLMDGKWAENYHFLKNDLLTVDVVELIDDVYNRIGVVPPSPAELWEITSEDKKVWDIYAKGHVMGINQFEQQHTKNRTRQYSPKNVSELSALVAAIRPGFKSMFDKFVKRETFNYGIPAFDQLIQTEEMPYSYMLYQEMAMNALNYSGIPMAECEMLVKAISKKNKEFIFQYRPLFLEGFVEEISSVQNIEKHEAEKIANNVWQILEDSSRYSFNAAHSICVATDSLYGAWLKAYHPLEFYEQFLRQLDRKGAAKTRIAETIAEAKVGFGIKFPPLRFGQDNRAFTLDVEKNEITMALKAIKGFGSDKAERMFEARDLEADSFVEFLVLLDERGLCQKWVETLISLNYFEKFGGNKKLGYLYKEFTEGKFRYRHALKEKTKAQRLPHLRQMELETPDESLSIIEQIKLETELFGQPMSTYDVPSGTSYILEVMPQNSPRVKLYGLGTGKIVDIKVLKKEYVIRPFVAGDIVRFRGASQKPRQRYDEEKSKAAGRAVFTPIEGEMEMWCSGYIIVEHGKK